MLIHTELVVGIRTYVFGNSDKYETSGLFMHFVNHVMLVLNPELNSLALFPFPLFLQLLFTNLISVVSCFKTLKKPKHD